MVVSARPFSAHWDHITKTLSKPTAPEPLFQDLINFVHAGAILFLIQHRRNMLQDGNSNPRYIIIGETDAKVANQESLACQVISCFVPGGNQAFALLLALGRAWPIPSSFFELLEMGCE